ncbi:MAG: protein kinase [Chloroflexota bacterium]
MIGTQLGHYKILSQLGRGGMASVFKAEQQGLSRLVAIKILQPSLAADEVIVQRFQQEARIAANLHHAHVVTIYDVGEVGGVYYIAMRYIEGENLGQLLRREGPLEPSRAIRMLEQLAGALDFAHSRNVLHRDIKPANVMVEPGDVLTLTDFGIARAGESSQLTATHMVIGTPEYMSPEQARGDPVDKRSDLYALGVLFYEMLGGRPPFSAASTPSLLYLHVHEPPPPLHHLRPDLPRGLSDVLVKALAKDPQDRFQSSHELVEAARQVLNQASRGAAGPPTSAGTAQTILDPSVGNGGRPFPPTPTPQPPQMPRTPAPVGRPQGPQQGPPQGGNWGAVGPAPVPRPMPNANATRTLTPPPVPPQSDPRLRPVGRPEDEKKRSNTWILGPVVVALALLVVGALVITQSGLIGGGSSSTPTPTTASAKPTTATTPTAGATAQVAAVPSATTQAAAKPTEPPAAKPTAPPSTNTPVPPTSTPAPPPTPNPEQRVTTAQQAVAAGDFPKAIGELRALRDDPAVKGNQQLAAQVDETLRKAHVVYGNQLLEQNKLDDSYAQFGEALKILATDQEALDGQKRVILTKNYATMEANWGKDEDTAIKALEENMALDPNFRDTRQKLYALLLGKADRLLAAGDRNGAFPILMRALDVLPDGGEAQKRLASYTPTPVPAPTPRPYVPPSQPAPSQPAPSQPAPSQPFRPPGSPV